MDGLMKLAAAIDKRACEIQLSPCDQAELMADAKDLIRALARILAGQPIHVAFGSPGDWGYSTDIGKALVLVYSEAGGMQAVKTLGVSAGRLHQ